jgi:rhodanese-related sulfurtransferase
MRKQIFLFFIVILTTTWSAYSTNDTIYRNITVVQADSLIQANTGNPDFIIIDLRQASYYVNGHIANAINIDYYAANFSALLDALDHSKKYLIYCQSGYRSGLTFTMMQNKHFKEVYNMLNGLPAWISAGYPTVTGTLITENNVKNFTSIVYPNPVTFNSVIQTNYSFSATDQIEIFNIMGKEIMVIPVTSNTISLSGCKFEKGEYFYLISSKEKILSSGKFEVFQ